MVSPCIGIIPVRDIKVVAGDCPIHRQVAANMGTALGIEGISGGSITSRRQIAANVNI